MEYPTDRLVQAAIVLVIASVVYASVDAMMPNILQEYGNKLQQTINIPEKDNINLQVNIPDQIDTHGEYYMYDIEFTDGDHTKAQKQNPYFEPNTFDVKNYNDIFGYINPYLYYNYTESSQDWENYVNNYEKINNYTDTNYRSPFSATESNDKDITKNIRFKSIRISKIETIDGKNITKTTENIKFNTEYNKYGELLNALNEFNISHADEAQKYNDNINQGKTNSEDILHYTYIHKTTLTATYTVSDGNNTDIKSSTFNVTSIPYSDDEEWSLY